MTILRIVDETVRPPTMISNPSFPDLTGDDFEVSGQVPKDPKDECQLIADRVDDTADATGAAEVVQDTDSSGDSDTRRRGNRNADTAGYIDDESLAEKNPENL